mgnify:CR=1 FL=1
MSFEIRLLEKNDYSKKYLELLSQLSIVENVTFEDWSHQFEKLNQNPYHSIYVMEDNGIIIASITLIVELKFLRGLSNVAHVEDLVVSNEYRGRALAKQLMKACIAICQSQNCYKIILNCNRNYELFYNALGFKEKNIQMGIYF